MVCDQVWLQKWTPNRHMLKSDWTTNPKHDNRSNPIVNTNVGGNTNDQLANTRTNDYSKINYTNSENREESGYKLIFLFYFS